MLLMKGAALARRAGLGPLIDRVRPAVLRRVGRGEAEVRGIVLEAETVEDRMYYGQLQGGREGFMADLFERSVEPGSVVADVGANVGFFTLLAARRVGADGAVYAFEPDSRNVRRLRANLARNGVEGVVTVVPKALSAADGVERFYVRDAGDVSSLYADEPYDRIEEVATLAGDRFFAEARAFDVVKIDVEGHEPAVLAGLAQSLQRPGIRLFVEYNPGALEAAGTQPEALGELLREAGFSVQVIDEEARALRPLEGRPAEYVNLYCER
jgi:FkbM family methyltransferase